MISIKNLKPSVHFLEILTYLLATRQINANKIQDLKELIEYWKIYLPDEHQDLLKNIMYLINNYGTLDNVDDYIILSKPLQFYYKINDAENDKELAKNIESKLAKFKRVYTLDKLYSKLDKTQVDLNNIDDVFRDITNAFIESFNEVVNEEKNEKASFISAQDLDILANNIDTTIRIPSFIPEIDLLTNGFIPGHIYLFAGALGGGKSALLMNVAMGLSLSAKLFGRKILNILDLDTITNKSEFEPIVLYISLENNNTQIKSRYFAILRDIIPFQKSQGFDTPLYNLFAKLNIPFISYELIDDTVYPFDVKNIIEELIANKYYPIAIVTDYLDEFAVSGNIEMRHKLGMITKILRTLAYKYKTVIITATQLNRKGIDGKLDISSLSESIEHAKKTDFLAFIHAFTGSHNDLLSNTIPNKDNNIFESAADNQYPIMHVKLVKNRIGLTLGKTNILTCTNSKLGFKSLVYAKNWELSLFYATSKNILPENLETALLTPTFIPTIEAKKVDHIHKPNDFEEGLMYKHIYNILTNDNIPVTTKPKNIIEQLNDIETNLPTNDVLDI